MSAIENTAYPAGPRLWASSGAHQQIVVLLFACFFTYNAGAMKRNLRPFIGIFSQNIGPT